MMSGRTHVRDEHGDQHREMKASGRAWGFKTHQNGAYRLLPEDLRFKQPLSLSNEQKKNYPFIEKVCINCLGPKRHLKPSCGSSSKLSSTSSTPLSNWVVPKAKTTLATTTTTSTTKPTHTSRILTSKTTTTSTTSTTSTSSTCQKDSQNATFEHHSPQNSISVHNSTEIVQEIVQVSAAGSKDDKTTTETADDFDEEAFLDDEEFEEEAKLDNQLRTARKEVIDYANDVSEWFKERFCIPKVYGGRPEESKKNWKVKNKVYSNVFPFPHPESLENHGTLGSYFLSSASFACSKANLVMVDWEAFYPEYMPSGGFVCVCGNKLERDGAINCCQIVRSLDLGFNILKYYRYRCRDCTKPKNPGKKSQHFTGISSHVLSQLNPLGRASISSFILDDGPIILTKTLHLVQALAIGGTSFDSISNAARKVIANELLELELYRMRFTLYRNKATLKKIQEKDVTSLLKFISIVAVRSNSLLYRIKTESNRQEPYIQQALIESGRDIDVFATDMVHVDGNRGSDEGMFGYQVAVNIFGEVIVCQGMTSKIFRENNAWLLYLNEIAPEILAVYTDDPIKERRNYKKLLNKGDSLQIIKDSFHIFKAISEKMRKGDPLKETCMREFVYSFFSFDAVDVERKKNKLRTDGKTEEEIQQLLTPTFLNKTRDVRRHLNAPEEIKRGLLAVLGKYITTTVFLKEMAKTLGNIIKLIDEGHVKDPEGVAIHINLGNEDNPEYLTRRGTGICENTNLKIQNLNLYRFSHENAHALLVLLLQDINHSAKCRNRRLGLPEEITDLTLINEFVTIYDQVSSVIRFPNPFRDFVKVPAAPSERFFSGLKFDNPDSSRGTALRLLQCDEKGLEGLPASIVSNYKISRSVEVVGPIPRAIPFKYEDERILLRCLLRGGKVIKKSISYFDTDGKLKFSFWSKIYNGEISKLVNVEDLCLQYNLLVIDAKAHDEERIEYNGRFVNSKNLELKEISHVRNELREYATRVTTKSNLESQGPPRPLKLKEALPGSLVVASSLPLSNPNPDIPEAAFQSAPVYLPTSSSSSINRQLTSRDSSERGRKSIVDAEDGTQQSTKKHKTCPYVDCGGKKTHKPNCLFSKWRLDPDKSQQIARLRIEDKQENAIDAFRRVFLENLEEIKSKYLSI